MLSNKLSLELTLKINIMFSNVFIFLSTVSSLSCDDMQLLGSGVTSMTTSELEAMTDSDFLDCASFLGGFSTWSDSQLQSLLTVATRSGVCKTSIDWLLRP